MEVNAPPVCADNTDTKCVLATLAERIGPRKFNAWFRHGTRMSIEDGYVRVGAANPFVANWIETHYQGEIARAVGERTGGEVKVVVTVDPTLSGELRRVQLDSQADIVQRAGTGRTRPRRAPQPAPLRYRLDDFLVGESNRLAYSAASAIARGARTPFSHLFVHGSCGVGKTHLLQGICNAARKVRAGGAALRSSYVTAEQFTNEFVTSLRKRQAAEFRRKYRKLDLLVIDDVHFLAAKKATQEEFLHTFNAIQSAGRRIVLASDAHPRLVGEMNEQLVSRFVAGMVVKIDPPDSKLRMKILRRRAKVMRLDVKKDVLEYIARHIRGSVRELEGAMFRLGAASALSQSPITLAEASEALADHLARTDSAITLGDIEATVAAFFGISPADLHSTRRTKTVCAARTIAMFLARRHTRMSFPEIGRAMGKNHSSVILAVQRMEKKLAEDGEVAWLSPMGPKTAGARKLLMLLTEQFA